VAVTIGRFNSIAVIWDKNGDYASIFSMEGSGRKRKGME
jgi:hypothetical protein